MNNNQESPEYVRLSQAAAMTLGLMGGSFYRDAKLYCINILLTYSQGCTANCSYCGLSRKRPGDFEKKSFIRVSWPTYSVEEIANRVKEREHHVKRVCISMITRRQAVADTAEVAKKIRAKTNTPISYLISPTVVRDEDFQMLKDAGADKIGIAIDAATPKLFSKHRGAGVGGPHNWGRYWECFDAALKCFGKGNVGSHFVVGLGETEQEMLTSIQKIKNMGGETHLFSFFPEQNSLLADFPRPHVSTYRRVQLARYLIDQGASNMGLMKFDSLGRIVDFGVDATPFINSGKPFMTSGCVGVDGEVACNRPFANERPSEEPRNFPFPPSSEEIAEIAKELKSYPA